MDAVLADPTVRPFRSRSVRDSSRVTLSTPHGPVDGYLKRHRISTAAEWRSECGGLAAGPDPALAEANAIGLCEAAGVKSMTVLAVGSQVEQPVAEGFFLSAALAGQIPAVDLFNGRFAADLPAGFDAATQKRVQAAAMAAIGRACGRLHRAGLLHQDLYLDHFYVDPVELRDDPTPTARLIDLQRLRPVRSARRLAKDVAQMAFSCSAHPDARSLWADWVRHYDQPDADCPTGALSAATRWRLLQAAGRRRIRQGRYLIRRVQRMRAA